MRQAILDILTVAEPQTTQDLAMLMHADAQLVQGALHVMDDDGDVIMRGGLYRLSAAARKRQEGGT